MNALSRLYELATTIGVVPAVEYAVKSRYLRTRAPRGHLMSLRIKGYRYPLWARLGTSDVDVFEQIFVKREYQSLSSELSPTLIVDCGANVGYSSVYFLNTFLSAHVIAIEPDAGNVAVCRQNLRPYGPRASVLQSGVWSHPTSLVVVSGTFRDGREWASQVRECYSGERPDVPGIDLASLLDQSPHRHIDLLKIDIEGAEAVLFAQNVQNWLPRVRNIIIELHDRECETIFLKALAPIAMRFRDFASLRYANRSH